MTSAYSKARMEFAAGQFPASFDREPTGFSHNLSGLDLFGTEELRLLAERYKAHRDDYFVAGSAPAPGAEFYSAPASDLKPHEAFDRLDSMGCRILLKRPENHDHRFRELLDVLFEEVVELRGGLGGERVVRLESAVFITSAATTTPFHFDPEIGFFSQIAGEKIYHVYPPSAVAEEELERFYLQGRTEIGQLDLAARDPAKECVFHLAPGRGFHQPQNAPHWVETGASRSISYTFVFETDASRARGRTRSFNHYLRKLGLAPEPPGGHQGLDAFKATTMQAVIPARQKARRVLRKLGVR